MEEVFHDPPPSEVEKSPSPKMLLKLIATRSGAAGSTEAQVGISDDVPFTCQVRPASAAGDLEEAGRGAPDLPHHLGVLGRDGDVRGETTGHALPPDRPHSGPATGMVVR
ncbi:hypothetical protein STANM309S_00823 [Streptomyces tanashiensis]